MATPTDTYKGARGPIGLRAPRKLALAKWFREFGEDQARERGLYRASVPLAKRNEYIAKLANAKLETLNKTTKELRQIFKGFDAQSGYGLNEIRHWPLQRVRQVEKYGEYLHHLKSQPHEIVRPHSVRQRISLQTFSGQYEPKQKAYIVHKSHPDEVVQITPTGQVIVTRELPADKGVLYSEFYFFRALLGYQPMDWDEVYAATVEILPFMPEGDYFIYSTLHGEIDAPQPKRSLLRVIMRYMQEYSQRNFAQTIAGFKRIAHNISADEEYSQIYYRRQREKRRRKQEFDKLLKRVARATKKRKLKRKTK
jgi:hypothetical protein